MPTKSRHLILALLISHCTFLAAQDRSSSAMADTPVSSLLNAVERYEQLDDTQRRTEVANTVMGQLSEFIGDDIHFTVDSHPDSVAMNVYYWSAEYLYDCQYYDSALHYALKAMPLCQDNHSAQMAADCTSLLAITYLRLGNTQEAAHYARQCYEQDLKSGDPDNISSSLNTLAAIYVSANLPQEAEQYILKGIDYSRQAHNEARLATLLGMASEVYHALDDQQQALDYARQAYDLEIKLQRPSQAGIRLSQMAAALTGLGRYAEARQHLQSAIKQFEADGNLHSLGIACNKMGEVLKAEKKMGEAATFFARGAEIFQQLGDPYNEIHSQLGLYNSLKDSLPEEAMRHMERHNQLKDTIYSREVAANMSRYHAEVGNAELLAEGHKLRSLTHTYFIIGGIAFGVLLIVSLTLLWRLRRRNAEFKQQLEALAFISASKEDNVEVASEVTEKSQVVLSERDRQFLEKVKKVVERQIDEGHVDVTSMAQELCMSITAFRRRFVALVDENPQAYVMRIRMEKARRLLMEHPEMTVSEIGTLCGFDDKSNFTRAFKHAFGVPPTVFVKQQNEANDTN